MGSIPVAAKLLASSLRDARQIFGEANQWRKAGEPMTADDWANYDRIAPRYSQRLEQWRRGEIRSQVHHPRWKRSVRLIHGRPFVPSIMIECGL